MNPYPIPTESLSSHRSCTSYRPRATYPLGFRVQVLGFCILRDVLARNVKLAEVIGFAER